MNLFESFNNIVNEEFSAKIKSISNDNLGDNLMAIKGIFHTLVAGLIRRCNSDMSSGMLFNQIQEKYQKSVLPEDFLDKLSKPDFLEKVNNDGAKIISQIFPAYKSPLISMISTYAGTSKNSTVLCSAITANILIDILGSKIKNDKFSKEDMVNFLRNHHEPLFKETPEVLMDKMIPALGLQELTTAKFVVQQKKVESGGIKSLEEESNPIANYQDQNSEPSVMNKKVILGLIVLGICGLLGYLLYLNKDKISFLNKDTTPVESVAEDLAFEDSLNAQVALPKKDSLKTILADSTIIKPEIAENQNDVISNFAAYISDNSKPAGKVFDFKSITYIDNTFELNPASIPVIEKIANELISNPKLQIKIIAFDKVGDLKLNNKRAFAVKKILINKGVETIRIDAGSGGVGDENAKIKVITK